MVLFSLITLVNAYLFDMKRVRVGYWRRATRRLVFRFHSNEADTLEHALSRERNLGPAFKSSLSRWQRELRAVLKPGVSEPPQ